MDGQQAGIASAGEQFDTQVFSRTVVGLACIALVRHHLVGDETTGTRLQVEQRGSQLEIHDRGVRSVRRQR
jgi:hypothetical protein